MTLGSRDPRGWPEAVEAVLSACPGLELVALSPPSAGGPGDGNPYGLPEDDRADVVLVPRWWHRWLTRRHPERADEVLRELERRANVLVGLEGGTFALRFPPSALERFAIVIKFEGILPCFMLDVPAVRRRSRAITTGTGPRTRRVVVRATRPGRDLAEAVLVHTIGSGGGRWRPFDVHCLAGLTHVQRFEVMELLEGLSGTRGIVPKNHPLIMGTRFGEAADLHPEVRDELAASVRRYSAEPVDRLRFMLGLRRHRVAVAPTGHGELSCRHAEALCTGTALVCQDLSHVEMMLPLEDRVNAAFCRPDLSDLRATVDELLRDDDLRNRIARAGRRSYLEWSARWRAQLDIGIEAHIREAIGRGTGSARAGGPGGHVGGSCSVA